MPQLLRRTTQRARLPIFAITALVALIFGVNAFAASFETAQYEALMEQAIKKKYVAVLVGLNAEKSLVAFKNRPAQTRANIQTTEAALLRELGRNALGSAVWSSGIGQVAVYVTPRGLEQLSRSQYVQRLMPDFGGRSKIHDALGQFPQMQRAIDAQGSVNVSVLLNLDTLEWGLNKSGQSTFRSTPALEAEHSAKVNAFLDSLPASGVLNLNDVQIRTRGIGLDKRVDGSAIPQVQLRINQEGLWHLLSRSDIRALNLPDADSTSSVSLSPKALDAARRDGQARVIVDLKLAPGYSPNEGYMSKLAWNAQAEMLDAAFVDIVAALEPKALRGMNIFRGMGSAAMTLSFAALQRLYASPDLRIRSLSLNEPMASPQLDVSTGAGPGGINVQNLWSRNNIRGAGQWIAVLDTGVDRWHPFFAGKYIGEACFGTNDPNYESLCPGQDAAGDSSPGVVGSGMPCGGRLNGDNPSYFMCRHGTKVAGIAGGRNGRYGMNGVAPDANFFFINVFSSNRANRGDVSAFREDQLRALQVIRDLAPSFQQITVNMSLGSGYYTAPCDYVLPSYANVVASLKSVHNIPIIASAGNQGYRDAIHFPACISNVIKVAASSKYNGTLWSQSNTVNPAVFGANPYTGPIFVAPGGDENIQTSRPGNMYESFGGTSAAAPHMAGVYALVKSVFPGISVDSITSYINDQASVPISIPTPAGIPPYTLRRVVLPTY